MPHPLIWTYAKLVLTAVIWGGTFIAGRIAMQSMGPFTAAFWRFAIAATCLLLLSRQPRFAKHYPTLAQPLNRHQWILVILLGLTGIFLYNIFFLLGLRVVPASRAALIVASNPVFVALGAALFFKEKLTRLKLLGIGLSLTGAAIVIAKGNPLALLATGVSQGDLFLLVGLATWVAYTLLGRRAAVDIPAMTATTYACSIGAIALLPLAIAETLHHTGPPATAMAWFSILYMGTLASAAGFLWYYDGVKAIGAAKASIFINLVPPSAIVLAAWLLHEPITPTLLLGGSLVILGIFCTNRG
jgi:drug/metabolite transporter (DMT)-like permease